MQINLIVLILTTLFVTGCNHTSIPDFEDNGPIQVEKQVEENTFFFTPNTEEISYDGTFMFYDIEHKQVNLGIKEVGSYEDGKVYELKLNQVDVEGVPNDRLNLGLFYVQADKICKIEATEANLELLQTEKELPKERVVVCQRQPVTDWLGEYEENGHHELETTENQCTYTFYNDQVGTGYYETIVWEKDKGLIAYRSGFGAERDAIELTLSNEEKAGEDNQTGDVEDDCYTYVNKYQGFE